MGTMRLSITGDCSKEDLENFINSGIIRYCGDVRFHLTPALRITDNPKVSKYERNTERVIRK